MNHHLHNLPPAPQWSLIVGPAGRGLIIAGAAFFLLSALFSLLSERNPRLKGWSSAGFIAGSVSIFGAFACLIALFLGGQFQYNYVFAHSQKLLDLKYKISAAWSGQEGSFLLWAVTSAIFGVASLKATRKYRRWYVVVYGLFLATLCGILAYETPFAMSLLDGKAVLPPDGSGMTPALQNYWMVIHPPIIFLGFGSLTVMFAWAMSAMLSRRPLEWIPMVRPWAIFSMTILGLGVSLGGFWAYETLGWGGFWAWDPVENTSFVPWLLAVVFVHGIIMQASRQRWVGTNLLLGGLPFVAFVYGTFLTRSGFLANSSVHSFAEMQRSALWILFGLGVVSIGAFLYLWIGRGRALGREFAREATDDEAKLSRSTGYNAGMIVLSAISVCIAIGMSVPFFFSLFGKQTKVVNEALYHQVLAWPMVPTLLLLAVVPYLSWRGMSGKDLMNSVASALIFAISSAGVSLFLFKLSGWGFDEQGKAVMIPITGLFNIHVVPWIAFLIFLATFAGVANLFRLFSTVKRSPLGIGGYLAHFGLAMFLAGMFLSRGFEVKKSTWIQKSKPDSAFGYQMTLGRMTHRDDRGGLSDRDGKVEIHFRGLNESFVARPGFFYFMEGEQMRGMVWPHIQRHFSHDIYVHMGEPVLEVWEEPIRIKPGESLTRQGTTVTYEDFRMEGGPGVGARMIADVEVKYDDVSYKTQAWGEVTEAGYRPNFERSSRYMVPVLMGIDPADRSATIQLYFSEPIYPIDVYYKPMTAFVWGGAGILTLGGLLAAFYRRPPRAKRAESVETTVDEEVPSESEYATVPTS